MGKVINLPKIISDRGLEELLIHNRKYRDIVDVCRKQIVEHTLAITMGNILEAARMLRIYPTQIYKIIKTLGVEYDGPYATKRGGKIANIELRARARAANRGDAGDGQGGSDPNPKHDQGHELGRTGGGRRSVIHNGTGLHSKHTGRVEGRGQLYGDRKATVLAPGHQR